MSRPTLTWWRGWLAGDARRFGGLYDRYAPAGAEPLVCSVAKDWAVVQDLTQECVSCEAYQKLGRLDQPDRFRAMDRWALPGRSPASERRAVRRDRTSSSQTIRWK